MLLKSAHLVAYIILVVVVVVVVVIVVVVFFKEKLLNTEMDFFSRATRPSHY